MQSKNLSETLLYHSQFTGVKITNKNTLLSKRGHGLYIESQESDRYIDLRLCSEKPFWGHTHPLTIQNEFNKLSDKKFQFINDSQFYSSLYESQKDSLFKEFQRVSLKDLNSISLKKKKLYIQIDEVILTLTDKEIASLTKNLQNLMQNNELVIEEKNIINFNAKNIFFFENIQCTNILKLSFIDSVLIRSDTHISESNQDIHFFAAMHNYMHYLIYPKGAKFEIDCQRIDQYIQSKSLGKKIQRKGHYLSIQGISFSNEILIKFLDHGIYLTQKNFYNNQLYLAIAIACTEDELLDTLRRISQVLLES